MRPALIFGGLVAFLLLSVAVGIGVGAVGVSPADVLGALAGHSDGTTATIVRDLRLPRVIAAALVGGGLAVAGVLLQGLTRNPLADPYVTGSSAGAGLAAMVAIALVGPVGGAVVPVSAFAGALVAVAVVWQLARLGGRTTVLTILLAGVVMTTFAGAAITLLLVANDRLSLRLRAVIDVLVGSVNIRSSGELAAAALIVAVGLGLALVVAPRIDAYAFGEETAATLGVDTDRVTAVALTAAALLAGASVALAGLVGFVGLVIPHAVRLIVGAGHRGLVIMSALLGAATLVLADAAARVALSPVELPVGVITGLVGAPFFLVLLVRSRRVSLV